MDTTFEDRVKRLCRCEDVEMKFLLEMISICPQCQTFASSLMFDIPQDQVVEVMDRIIRAMADLGIQSRRRPEELIQEVR